MIQSDNGTTNNVKIVFFDVLVKQINSLIVIRDKLNEADEMNGAELSEAFDKQFNNLRETLINVENLMVNIENFDNSSSGTGNVVNNSMPDINIDTSSENSDVNEASSEVQDEIEGDEKDEDEPVSEPLIPVSPAVAEESNIFLNNFTNADNDEKTDDGEDADDELKQEDVKINLPEDNKNEEDSVDDSSPEEDSVDISAPVEEESEANNLSVDEEPVSITEDEEPKLEQPLVELASPNTDDKVKYMKISNNQTKAIIVNANQLEKLRLSKDIQKSKLNFGDLQPANNMTGNNTTNKDEMIQQLLQKAGELYKQGNAIEAEKIYETIRTLNTSN